MREISVSTTLTVYHDGRFWVGVALSVEGTRSRAARVVFGPEPSDEEILQLVLHAWERLRFSADAVPDRAAAPPENPKRRQREAARLLKRRGAGTRAQQALAAERERAADEHRAARSQRRRDAREMRFAMRAQKRRRRRRGH